MPRLDLGNILVESGVGVIGGGVQRMAWESSQMIGMATTGGLMLGGILIQAMVDQPLLRQVGQAAAISGATVAGWVSAEKFLITGTPRRLGQVQQQGALQAAAMRQRALAGSRAGSDGRLAQHAMALIDDRNRTDF
mgnify:CR=1 FL=1